MSVIKEAGLILLKSKLLAAISAGDIFIDPYNEKNVGPNSIDLTLNPKLLVYDNHVLDMDKKNPTRDIIIPNDGLMLLPGVFYLGSTNEVATSDRYVPFLEGRSSVARLGITVHAAAGVGDIGFAVVNRKPTGATWTLEISVAKPVIVYPNRRVCQVIFLEGVGDICEEYMYHGKYNHQMEAQSSLMSDDYELASKP